MRKTIPKRIISMLLLVAMIITSSPMAIAYADDRESNATGTGDDYAKDTSGKYDWGWNKQGYRVTILDSTGVPISNSVDFLFSTPNVNGTSMVFTNSKVESLTTSKEKPISPVILDNTWLEKMDMRSDGDYITLDDFPRAIVGAGGYLSGNSFYGNGESVKAFLLSGTLDKLSGQYTDQSNQVSGGEANTGSNIITKTSATVAGDSGLQGDVRLTNTQKLTLTTNFLSTLHQAYKSIVFRKSIDKIFADCYAEYYGIFRTYWADYSNTSKSMLSKDSARYYDSAMAYANHCAYNELDAVYTSRINTYIKDLRNNDNISSEDIQDIVSYIYTEYSTEKNKLIYGYGEAYWYIYDKSKTYNIMYNRSNFESLRTPKIANNTDLETNVNVSTTHGSAIVLGGSIRNSIKQNYDAEELIQIGYSDGGIVDKIKDTIDTLSEGKGDKETKEYGKGERKSSKDGTIADSQSDEAAGTEEVGPGIEEDTIRTLGGAGSKEGSYILNMLRAKDTDGELLFKKLNGDKWELGDIFTQKDGWVEDQENPCIDVYMYSYKILVEPIVWFTMPAEGTSPYLQFDSYHDKVFYGTITNMYQFCEEHGYEGKTIWGYASVTRVGKVAMTLQRDEQFFIREDEANNIQHQDIWKMKYSSSIMSDDGINSDQYVADATINKVNSNYLCPDYGLACHIYKLSMDKYPSTQTHDDSDGVSDIPAKAPDSNIEKTTEEEAEETGKDAKDEVQVNEETVHTIVKYYEHEDEDGNPVHEQTFIRENCLRTIDVQDETNTTGYTLVEWVFDDNEKLASVTEEANTPWEGSASTIDKTKEIDVQVEQEKKLVNTTVKNYGTDETRVVISNYKETESHTLYVRLRKVERTSAVIPGPTANGVEDLTESQITKVSGTKNFNLDGYEWKLAIPSTGGGHDDGYWDTDEDGDRYYVSRTGHYHRTNSTDHTNTIGFKLPTTSEDYVQILSGASEFQPKLLKDNSTLADTASYTYEWPNSTATYKYIKGFSGTSDSSNNALDYITTIHRLNVDSEKYLTLAEYKYWDATSESTVDKTAYNSIKTIINSGIAAAGRRLDSATLTENLKFTLTPESTSDLTTTGYCAYCGTAAFTSTLTASAGERGTASSVTGTVTAVANALTFEAPVTIHIYSGEKHSKTTGTRKTESLFSVKIGNKYTNNSSCTSDAYSNPVSFYSYIKMSFLKTADWETALSSPSTLYNKNTLSAESRTVYILSDEISYITPKDSVEISWYNDAQANGGYGLQLTSQQWSTHARAISGDAAWQQKNSVLPGGAIYFLSTDNTESYIQTITYASYITDNARKYISCTGNENYMNTAKVINNNIDYLKELKETVENFRIVQWVASDYNASTAWAADNAVKIAGEQVSLKGLGLNNSNSIDSKYLLLNGTNANAVNEADLDILHENYTSNIYKCFTNVNGDVYLMVATKDTKNKTLTEAELSSIAKILDRITGDTVSGQGTVGAASVSSTITSQATALGWTITVNNIGTKAESNDTILSRIKSENTFIANMENQTNLVQNTLKAVTRNMGNDTNATWLTNNDGKWYNEAFDGIYVVAQQSVFEIGIGTPSKRTSVLDPNLCPAKTSKGDTFTNAFISQFCIDTKSTSREYFDEGYVATYNSLEVTLPNLNTLMYSRPFYIPNANVQDLSK